MQVTLDLRNTRIGWSTDLKLYETRHRAGLRSIVLKNLMKAMKQSIRKTNLDKVKLIRPPLDVRVKNSIGVYKKKFVSHVLNLVEVKKNV